MRRLELWFWSALPSLLVFFLLLLSLAPKHTGGADLLLYWLPMASLYYWGVHQPRHMPYATAFAAGIIIDTTGGFPLGLNGLLNMAFLGVLRVRHKSLTREGFIFQWGYFILLLSGMQAIHWLLVSMLTGQALPIGTAVWSMLLIFCCYPCLHQLFHGIAEQASRRRWLLLHQG